MDFLANLDAEIIKAELLMFLETQSIENDTTMEDFTEQFVEFIKEDLSRVDG